MLWLFFLLAPSIVSVLADTSSLVTSTNPVPPLVTSRTDAQTKSSTCIPSFTKTALVMQTPEKISVRMQALTAKTQFDKLNPTTIPDGYMSAYWFGWEVNYPLESKWIYCDNGDYGGQPAFKPKSGGHVAYGAALGSWIAPHSAPLYSGGLRLISFAFACSYVNGELDLEYASSCKVTVLSTLDNTQYGKNSGTDVVNLGIFQFNAHTTCETTSKMTTAFVNDTFGRINYYFYMIEGYGQIAIDNVVFSVPNPDGCF